MRKQLDRGLAAGQGQPTTHRNLDIFLCDYLGY